MTDKQTDMMNLQGFSFLEFGYRVLKTKFLSYCLFHSRVNYYTRQRDGDTRKRSLNLALRSIGAAPPYEAVRWIGKKIKKNSPYL